MAEPNHAEPRHSKLNVSTFNVSRWAVEHPYIVIAFYTAMVVLCILAVLFYMPRRMMPYVESPMIGVVTTMPGLSAEEMETYISKPIEERMVAIQNARFIRSSSQNGFSIVSLEFPYGNNMKKAFSEVQALMTVVQADLPVTGANLKPSWVLAIDPLNGPVLTLGLTGDERWDAVKLRELAQNEIVNRLKTVPNVYAVQAYGGKRRQLQVIVDRNSLASYGLSIMDVKQAIDQYNVARPAGMLTGGEKEEIVRVSNLALKPIDVENYVVKALPGGKQVYLRDVARVLDTFEEQRSAYHFIKDGKSQKAVGVSVLQNPDASSPQVIADTEKMLKKLERDYPGIHFEVAYDNAHFVDILFHNLFEELGLAILLTGTAILFFMNNWRATIISLMTIPVTLSMAILGLIPFGLGLNSSTLIGLLLSIGILVDDTVVDIHAMLRHMKMGKPRKEAIVDGVTGVRLAVFASALMLLVALSPLLFSGGITQQMFVGLVTPIMLGIVFSFLIELTLTPVIALYILKLPDPDKRPPWFMRVLVAPFQRLIVALEDRCAQAVGWGLRHRFTVVTIGLAILIVGTGVYRFIGSEMMPLADIGQAYGLVEMKPGTSFARTEQVMEGVEAIIADLPEVEQVSIRLGYEPGGVYYTGYSADLVNSAAMMITFSDKTERERTIFELVDLIHDEALKQYPEDIRRIQVKEMGSDVMATAQAPISILVHGKDLNILDQMGQQLAGLVKDIPGLVQVATDWTMGLPENHVNIDTRKAQEFGLTPKEISQQLYYALRGGYTDEFFRPPNIRQDTILVRYEDTQRRPNDVDLEEAYLVNKQGQSVPLKSVATIEKRNAPTVVSHDGIRRIITVLGYYRPGGAPSMDLTMASIQKAVANMNFPPGYGLEVRGDMTQMMDSFKRLLWGLLLAVVMMYLVLVGQFKGWIQPFQMILSLPMMMTGVLIGLLVMNQHFSTVSIMALIVLTGMNITTAILMIDMINKHREAGLPRMEAIQQGAVDRMRPILMTTITTCIVMVPVSIFPKTGMDAYSPLGTVVLWGLLSGTFLSILVVPVMHSLIDDVAEWLQRRRERLLGGETS